MTIALGLDAGGTYTDAVLYDPENDHLLASSKSATTPPTYIEGVASAVHELPADIREQASFVALSTTLATNAIVENRHATAGLVLIGYDSHEAAAVGWQPKRVVPGRHTIRGIETEAFDEAAFRGALEELLAEGVAGLAISSVMSVRNPAHELRALEIAAEMTDLPLVGGREVAEVLNAIVRAETAALNAGLIPLVHRFIDAVRTVLDDAGLSRVPCFMVTGDGSLMSTDAARKRPVETILSGPACSAFGAARLARETDALVVDVGGTTTDIAVLESDGPRMADGGVKVGAWRTGIRSAAVLTRGLGGDSAIGVRPRLTVGPRRVVPISSLGRHDSIARSFAEVANVFDRGGAPGGDWWLTNPSEAFIRVSDELPAALSPEETALFDALADGPLTRMDLAQRVEYPHMSLLRTNRLEQWGVIARAGLTPTDLWHLTGEYEPWDTETARVAARLTAYRLMVPEADMVRQVREHLTRSLMRQVVEAHLGVGSDGDASGYGQSKPNGKKGLAERLAAIALGEEPSDGLRTNLALTTPIVGVGAPAKIFLDPVAGNLRGTLIVPEGASVANAIGAAAGGVSAQLDALIRPQEDGSILCYGHAERRTFETRDEAVKYATAALVPGVSAELGRRGAGDANVTVRVQHRGAEVTQSMDPIWWETAITARGVGRPAPSAGDAQPEVTVAEEWTPGLQDAEERHLGQGTEERHPEPVEDGI